MSMTRRDLARAALAMTPLAFAPSISGAAGSGIPTVTGPLTGGKRGWPFACPIVDVTQRGYVVEEFILQGSAKSYRPAPGGVTPPSGLWQTVPSQSAPFTTRAYVVRPANAADFNGVAVVNWQNVTAGFDIGAPINPEIFRGYAWIGVTAQQIGVHGTPGQTIGLPQWDPQRYASLQHPGDAWSYDIFTQAGRLLRDPGSTNARRLLGGLQPTTLIATGGSQSAMRLGSYLNAAHQHERVFDGFHLTVHWGICPPLEEMQLGDLFAPTQDALSPAMCAIRDDGDVPIMVVATECEARYNLPVRQDDSDTFRFWEIAGAAHQGPSGADMLADIMRRDGVDIGPSQPDRNAIEWGYISDAALRSLVNWVRNRKLPPSIPRINMTSDPSNPIVRDELGNAVGGLRVPELEAPVATYRGERGDLSNPGWLQGSTTPLSTQQIAQLYPRGDPRTRAWNAAVDRLAVAGLVLPEDIDRVRARGAAS